MSKERYEIIGKIGQGGVGSVYKAKDTHLNREVAIKRVLTEEGTESSEEATKSLLKEATALSALQHPHIVTVYDSGVDEEGPYVVMENINGRTLDEMVERGTLTWNDLYEVALQTQEALIAAQDLGLVHRDLKPSNVMVCWLASGKFQVKIVDFGLAKFSATPSLQTIDHGDAVFGSIFFMAPEQFERTPLDQRTDMYAMGCLYYYALTGQYPFNGENAASVMASHLQHHVTPINELRPDIPQWGSDWIMWHIERDMDKRPTNAREALERLLVLAKQDQANASTAAVAAHANGPQFNFGSAPSNVAAMAPTQAVQGLSGSETAPVQITAPGSNALNPHTQSQQVINANTATVAQSASAVPTITATQAVSNQLTSNVTQSVNGATQPHLIQEGDQNFIAKLSKNAKISIISVLALAILMLLAFFVSGGDERAESKNYSVAIEKAESLIKQNKIEKGVSLTADEVSALLSKLGSEEDKKIKVIIRKALAYSTGSDTDTLIAQYISSPDTTKKTKTDILKFIVPHRKGEAYTKPLIQLAYDTDSTETAISSLEAVLKVMGDRNNEQHFVNVLNILDTTEDTQVALLAEKILKNILTTSKNKETLGSSIQSSLKSSVSDSNKLALIRLLGTSGIPSAGKIIEDNIITSDNTSVKMAGIKALEEWPDDSQFKLLTETIATSINNKHREHAFMAAYRTLIRHKATRNQNEQEQMWTQLSELAENSREKLQIISGVSSLKKTWTLSILNKYSKDSDNKVSQKAKTALNYVKQNVTN